jgi:type I restriction enzyme M protein
VGTHVLWARDAEVAHTRYLWEHRLCQESKCFHSFSYDELLNRDKVSLDLFRLFDESLEGADTWKPPDVLAASIVEDLQTVLEQFMAISEDLGGGISVNGTS